VAAAVRFRVLDLAAKAVQVAQVVLMGAKVQVVLQGVPEQQTPEQVVVAVVAVKEHITVVQVWLLFVILDHRGGQAEHTHHLVDIVFTGLLVLVHSQHNRIKNGISKFTSKRSNSGSK
jgi:hypothetical protein